MLIRSRGWTRDNNLCKRMPRMRRKIIFQAKKTIWSLYKVRLQLRSKKSNQPQYLLQRQTTKHSVELQKSTIIRTVMTKPSQMSSQSNINRLPKKTLKINKKRNYNKSQWFHSLSNHKLQKNKQKKREFKSRKKRPRQRTSNLRLRRRQCWMRKLYRLRWLTSRATRCITKSTGCTSRRRPRLRFKGLSRRSKLSERKENLRPSWLRRKVRE